MTTGSPNSLLSPCGRWRVEWNQEQITQYDQATGQSLATAGIPGNSIRPLRFLGQRRLLVFSETESAHAEFIIATGEVRKLPRSEDAVDDYAPITIHFATDPLARWIIIGILGPFALTAILGGIFLIAPISLPLGIFSIVAGAGLALTAAALTTEIRHQVIDPLRGTILASSRNCLTRWERRYLIEEFDRLERRRFSNKGNVYYKLVLAGRRDLALLDGVAPETIGRVLHLPYREL